MAAPKLAAYKAKRDFKLTAEPSGEAGVAASVAAVACAYARATGRVPTKFPINHDDPLAFEVKSFVPPVPASPTDGLNYVY